MRIRHTLIALFVAALAAGLRVHAQPDAKAGLPIPVNLTVPGKGFVSAGVYDARGVLVRSLSYAAPVEETVARLAWDATTDLGLPVAPGEYRVRGVWFPEPPRIEFRMKVGVSGTPPYPTPDRLGSWGANLGAPAGVASDGKRVLAVFGCVESSWETGVQLMEPDGRIVRRFSTFFPWDVRLACAMDGSHAYLAVAVLGKQRLVIGRYALDDSKGAILGDVPVKGAPAAGGRWKGRWTVQVGGLAVGGGRVFVPVTTDGRLVILDERNGRVVRTVEIETPRGVAVGGDRLYLLSGRRLLALDFDGSVQATLVAEGLDDPAGLAIGPDGAFYVADGGRAQQVKVFSPEGRPLRAIGAAGGRPRQGRFDPKGMLDPRGICLAPGNRLWVAEDNEDFQRISVWDAATGALVQEFFNCRLSSGQGRLSPDRTEMLFSHGPFADAPALTAYRVDFEKSAWYPSWHLDLPVSAMRQDDVFLGNTHIYGQLAASFDGRHPYLSFTDGLVRGTNGRTYAVGGEFSVYLFDPETCSMKLAALVYTHRARRLPDGRFEGDYDQGPNSWLAWADTDGNGRMDRAEVVFTERPAALEQTSRLFAWELQPDLSILMLAPRRLASVNPGSPTLGWTVFSLAPREVLPDGVPVYDWAGIRKVCDLDVPSFAGGDGWKGGESAYLHDLALRNGMLFTYAEPIARAKLRLGGIDGENWWASRNWRQTPMRFDPKTGRPEWIKLGRRAPGRAQPGEMYSPRPFAGGDTDIDGFVFVPDTLGNVWAWTDTGQYIGRLYNDPGALDRDSILVELVGSWVYKIGGRIYSCVGDHGVSVHEVFLPPLTRIEGPALAVTPAMAAAAVAWDPDGPAPGKRPVHTALSLFDYQANKPVRAITVDGKLDPAEWAGIQPMPVMMDGRETATVRAAWDREHLYLAYDVKDPVGLRNAGTELPLCPFSTGAYVDFCLGPQWQADGRVQVKAGDVRVILARITGKEPADYQMGFWPVRPGGRSPQTIVSPAAQCRFDDVSPVPDLRFAYQTVPGGYTLEVSAPLKAIGLGNIRQSVTVGFDASIGFADPTGALRIRAAHWAGESEAAVVDRPGSAELKPATWGTLVLDRSPVPAAPAQRP